MSNQYTGMEIAIIGISGRFPKAENPSELWQNLVQGEECISFYTRQELINAGCDPQEVDKPNYVPANAFVSNKDMFQPSFFGYSPKEAEILAPQLRLLHEIVWECLEDAGYNPYAYKEMIGLYAGASNSCYWESLTFLSGKTSELGEFDAEHLNNKDTGCAKVAYCLNLKGPVVSIQTECSTGLVAVHLAVKGLLTGECKMALAGGVSLSYQTRGGYLHESGMIRSSDGHCRAFDEKSDGTMLSEGGGIVLLKRLKDAIEDGDHIYALIKGSAINNDGHRKVGFTAPSIEGQAEVIRKAHKMARIDARNIRFVETHGTGTNLGDPIEVEALKMAFPQERNKYCALGSIKTNIGHLGEGAGVASLIKTALALKHRVLPASLNFDTPNAKINFQDSPFFVNSQLTRLERTNGTPLLAGISSFGIGGTNAHIVLEEYGDERDWRQADQYQIFPFSADNGWSLKKNLEKFHTHILGHPADSSGNVAHTLQVGRKHFPVRAFAVCADHGKGLADEIRKLLDSPVHDQVKGPEKIVFMFPGQGNQYANMTRGLYEYTAPFRKDVDACLEIVAQYTSHDLRSILYHKNEADATTDINNTEITQLLLFIVEYAMARNLMTLGIQPDILIGHSIGEYVAACLAGVFSLEDAIRIVAARGMAMQKAPRGKMLSVELDEAKMKTLLPVDISLASVNSKNTCVVSGEEDRIKDFQARLEKKGIPSRILITSHAFHSHLMDGILREFEDHFSKITLNKPHKTILSNLTGNPADPSEIVSPKYWVNQLRNTVRFSDGLEKLPQSSLLVEVGPGRSLSVFAKHNGFKYVVNTIRHPHEEADDVFFLYRAIGNIWSYGFDISWDRLSGRSGYLKIPLPTYSFRRERYWIDEGVFKRGLEVLQNKDKEKKKPFGEWFHQISWKQKYIDLSSGAGLSEPGHLLIFTHPVLFENRRFLQYVDSLDLKSVTIVLRNEDAGPIDLPPRWTLVRQVDDTPEFYSELVGQLKRSDKLPEHVWHFWTISTSPVKEYTYEEFIYQQGRGLFSIVNLAQAIRQVNLRKKVFFSIVSTQHYLVTGQEDVAWEHAPIQAAISVLPQEFHEILTKHIDFGNTNELIDGLPVIMRESTHDYTYRTIAYRNGIRWLQSFEQLKMSDAPGNTILRENGVYLITGGLGGVGGILSRHVASTYKAKIAVLSRSVLPPRESWNAYLEQHNDSISKKIQLIKEIELLGGTVLPVNADVGNEHEVRKAIERVEAALGEIHGVIHAAAETQGLSHVCTVDQVNRNLIEEQFYAKIKGIMTLSECFKGRPLDFMMVTSSLSAVLGGLGFLAYSASNIFVDQFVAHKNKDSRTPWITVNWDGWEDQDAQEKSDLSETYILPTEGVRGFDLVCQRTSPCRVVVSTRDLSHKLKKWISLEQLASDSHDQENGDAGLVTIQRDESLPQYMAPENEIEKKLLEAWQKLFGIKNIGINDNFFELGGDSLKAIVLANRIFKELNVKISLQDLFRYTDIRNLGKFIGEMEQSDFVAIPQAAHKTHYKLTSPQRRFYFTHELDKTSLAYNMPVAVILRGSIDRGRFENAFKELIGRHESLRTSFEIVDGQCYQVISADPEFGIEYIRSSKDALDDRISAFVRPFDLRVAPLLRAGLIAIDETEHVLVLDIHHIITDAVSSELLVTDFMALYSHRSLPDLRLQFKDYAEWQQSDEQQKHIAGQKKFWLDEFSDGHEALDVPTDFSRPSVKRHVGDIVNFEIAPDDLSRLKTLAEEEGASVFMLLLAAFSIFQSKLSGVEKVVIGTSTAGREHPDLEHVIGLFVNTIPIKTSPAGTLTFRAFLAEVKRKTLACFENQSYPYEELVNELKIERNTNRNPLFDVMFAFLSISETKLELPDLKVEIYDIRHPVSKFDYTLQAYDNGEKIFFSFEYATDLFLEKTIRKFITYYKAILSAVIYDPGIRLSDISIVDDEERKLGLYAFNDTVASYPDGITIHQWFETQVSRTPDRTAVIFEDRELTYLELNNRANQLAHYFRDEFGVGRGTVVALCVQRTEKLMIALLAILKAGGAYLPVDPRLPEERVQFILAESDAGLLVIEKDRHADFEFYPGPVFTLDKFSDSLSKGSANPENANSPNDLAYIIYTSGSTGKPKGVMIAHRSLINYISWAAGYYVGQQDSVFALYTSLSFDLTVTSIFTPLTTGNRVIIFGDDENEVLIEKVFADGRANVIKLTPSHLKILRGSRSLGAVGPGANLRLIVGGEALDTRLARAVSDRFAGQVEIYNEYGPTEATVGCMIHRFNLHEDFPSVPIGVPISNTQIFVLDSYMNPVATGVTGELYIAGDGLATGYLKQEALTGEKFIANPFVPGKKMYRTGDLAFRLPDGKLMFKGRTDNQVKIRGYRIELGEIESAISVYGKVKDASVLVKEKDGNKVLVAYFVAADDIKEELRNFLMKRLPEYMVPAQFVHLSAMPLTINGKIDYKALPDPGKAGATVYLAPQSEEEKILCEAWCRVLGLEKVGVLDNFFSLGGDSIKSIQICARLQGQGYMFSIRDILRAHTVQKQALKLKKNEVGTDQSIVTGQTRLTPIQQWFMDGPILTKHHYNQSVVLNFAEGLAAADAQKIFGELQKHHDALRMVFRPDKRGWICENRGMDVKVSLEEHDLRHYDDAKEQMARLVSGIQSSIDLRYGPLMKLGLFHRDDGSRLLLVIHHLVIDAVSWRILFEDIGRLYHQLKKGEAFVLPSKTLPFFSWSNRLETYMKSRRFRRASLYWERFSEKGSGRLPVSVCDADLPGRRDVTFSLEQNDTTRLLTAVHRSFGTQINDVLLTALILGLRNQFGMHTALVDLESHGREDLGQGEDVSRTIGWFTTFYPVLLEEAGDLRSTIRQVKEILRSIPNDGIDYLLRRYFASDSTRKTESNVQISFNYLGQFDRDTDNKNFQIGSDSSGDDVAPDEPAGYEWDILGMVNGGMLKMFVSYNPRHFGEATMTSFMDHYKAALLQVMDFCSLYERKEMTPSDLTYRELTIDQLDVLQEQYEIKDIYPLSPMQEGMLFHSIMNDKPGQYFEQLKYRLKGNLDILSIEKSLNDLAGRHDMLRTLFLHRDLERPLQVVLRERKIDFLYEDIREALIEDSREAVVQAYLDADKSQGFDLGKDALMRVKVLRTGIDEYEFIWSHHHILMDGWCMGILVYEFNVLYAGHFSGSGNQLPVARPYVEYISWLEEKEKDDSEHYWRSYLAGYRALTGFPGDKMSLSGSAARLAKEMLSLTETQTATLKNISSERGVTLSTIMQTAWGILLSKYNNTRDILFGLVVSGRPAEVQGIETMIGLFINTVPVRITFGPDDTIADVLQQVQQAALDSEPHHYHPLSEIQMLSELGRGLLDHLLVFENYPVGPEVVHSSGNDTGFRVTDIQIVEETNYDLFLEIYAHDQLTIEFHYNADRYSTVRMKSALEHLTKILLQIISDCHVTSDSIDILLDDEKEAWSALNNTKCVYPENGSVISLFETQMQKAPDRVALRYEEYHLTYRQVGDLVDKIASYLDKNGIAAGDLVGVMLKRELYLVPFIFGILKAGAVYVPIDPGYPEERIMAIAEDAGLKLLITRDEFLTRGISSRIRVMDLNAELETIVQWKLSRRLVPCADSGLAYVIYTSGSTGKPKGVMIGHRSLLNLVYDLSVRYPLPADGVYLFKTPFIFDVSITEIFGWFLNGGSLLILAPDQEKEPVKVVSAIAAHKVTHVNFVPSFFNFFVQHLDQTRSDISSLKYVFVAGEAISVPSARHFKALFPECGLWNLYGPTEGTVYATGYEVFGDEDQSIPIGKPLSNTAVFVMDQWGSVVPVGIPGELCISGIGLALGYLNNEAITAEKFVEPRFPGGERFYKTGDLARLTESAVIEFMGRIDNQVKIRGFRIEPGEIEFHLSNYTGIQEVIVSLAAREGDQYLVAYYTSAQKIPASDLREYLRGRIPEYMVPAFYLWLEEMPLTPSGKVDRKLLPEINVQHSQFIAPSNSIEEMLAEIWAEVLKVDKKNIGIHDSFFALGGHSLKALSVVNKINQVCHARISLQTFFEKETIKRLAEDIITIRQIQHGVEAGDENVEVTI